MTSISSGAATETQNLGHSAPPSFTPPPQGFQQPQKKGGCCGCGCFSGCLVVLLLIVGLGVGFWYLVFHNARYVQHTDALIVWTYRNVARPKIVDTFSTGMSDAERQQFLALTDGAVEKYLALTPEDKQAILGEATTALWYLWTQQMLPPDQIPHLKKFAEELQRGWEMTPRQIQRRERNRPPVQPWPTQEPPRPSIPEPKESPRLLN